MRRGINILLTVALCWSVSAPSVALAKRPRSYKDIELPELQWSLPDFSEFELPNGIAGLVVEDHEVPLVDFYFQFKALPDPANKVGLSSMTAWTLRNGGGVNLPADSLNDIIECKAASLQISAGQEGVYMSGFCHKDDLVLLLTITRELIDNPAYPEDKIELKRSTMLEQIRRRYDRPYGIAFRELSLLLYPDHPWGRETSPETVGPLTRDDLLDYHRKVFQPSGAVIGFAGAVTSAEVEALAGEQFGDLTVSGEELAGLPEVGPSAEACVYYAYKDFNQAFVTMGHRTVRYDDPRRHAAEIMNYILGGGGFQSLLTKRIRVDEGLAYSVWSMFTMPVPVEGAFRALAATRLDQAGRTLALMDEVISHYREEGPTIEKFEKARRAYVNSYVWEYESSDRILSRLVYLKWRGLPLDTPQRDLEAYQQLTLEDVRRAAGELLHPDSLIVVVVGDRDKMDRPLEDFGKVHELDISSK